MKQVVHLSTTHTGGAGIAARHLNVMLNARNFDSQFIALDRKGFHIRRDEEPISLSLMERTHNKLVTGFNYLLGQPFFSLFDNELNKKTINKLARIAPIIHIHNFYNILDENTFSYIFSRFQQVVLTMHDQRLFTGGCHYSLKCEKYRYGCTTCPRVPVFLENMVFTKLTTLSRILTDRDQLTIVAPSDWIANSFRSSSLFSNQAIVKIPNVLNYPSTSMSSPKFQSNTVSVGFAASARQPIKGREILEHLRSLEISSNSYFKIYTAKDLGSDMKAFWSRIDLLIVPSLMDNHPNVITEAHLHGIPVIASNVGGIPEMTITDFDLLVENAETWQDQFLDFIKCVQINYTIEKGLWARNYVIQGIEAALGKHISLYRSLVSP
jgi:hypothetical protein